MWLDLGKFFKKSIT